MENEKVELTDEQKLAEQAKKLEAERKKEEMKRQAREAAQKAAELGEKAAQKAEESMNGASKKLVNLIESNPNVSPSILLGVAIFLLLTLIKFGTSAIGLLVLALLLAFTPKIIAFYKKMKSKKPDDKIE